MLTLAPETLKLGALNDGTIECWALLTQDTFITFVLRKKKLYNKIRSIKYKQTASFAWGGTDGIFVGKNGSLVFTNMKETAEGEGESLTAFKEIPCSFTES